MVRTAQDEGCNVVIEHVLAVRTRVRHLVQARHPHEALVGTISEVI